VSYEALSARGYVPPSLDAAAKALPPVAQLAQAPPLREPVPQTVLVRGADGNGRWSFATARSVGLAPDEPEEEPARPLKRPGAELAAVLRKRQLCAEVEAVLGRPGATFDASRASLASEKQAEAAARARLKERRLAAQLAGARGRTQSKSLP